ncbi:MAG: AraC family transcriptional regulator [Paracoccaceae bacterium]
MNINPQFSGEYSVVPMTHFAQGGRWRTEAMRSYSQPVLLWFTKGQGRITVAGITRGYGPHNAIFLPAGTMHGFNTMGQVFGSVLFFPNDPALDLPAEPQHLRFREARQQAHLTALIDNIQHEADREMHGQERALALNGGILAVWLDRQIDEFADDTSDRDASRRLTAAYTALVERDFRSAKNVNGYAADLGVTPTHLSRVCNIACNKPASVILADRIHFEARRLLLETRAPVKDIARELGFASPAYFSRAFQKQTGLTPSAFRNNP